MKINFKLLTIFLKKNDIEIFSKHYDTLFFDDIKSLLNSNKDSLTFFYDSKYKDYLKNTKAKACFIHKQNSHLLNPSCMPIYVSDPYKAFALTTNFLNFKAKKDYFIDPSSYIEKNVSLSKNVGIYRNVTIKQNAKIGDNTIISENSYIGENVVIGKNVIIYPNVVITNSIIGNNCIIQSGTIIGDSGFGFTITDKISIVHIGNVVIKDNVHIGSSTTIDRASLDSTIIGKNVRIDNLVQIAHSVIIGDNTVIAGQVGIAGSAIIGDKCLIGGQAGIAGHIKIGNNVIIAAKSGVTKNIPHNMIIAGFPAVDIKKWKKNIIKINKIV